MLNLGTPAWSDKYFKHRHRLDVVDDIVSVMTFGKPRRRLRLGHVRGPAAPRRPILSSGNLVDAAEVCGPQRRWAAGVIAAGGRRAYRQLRWQGRIFPHRLTTNLPAGAQFSDGMVEAAKKIVADAARTEKVRAVVFIGHQDRETDFAMAAAICRASTSSPAHSALAQGACSRSRARRRGSSVRLVPGNYLVAGQPDLPWRQPAARQGNLVPMDSAQSMDPQVWEVGRMQQSLETDPQYADRFARIGEAAVELDVEGIDSSESVLLTSRWMLRTAPSAHALFTTAHPSDRRGRFAWRTT